MPLLIFYLFFLSWFSLFLLLFFYNYIRLMSLYFFCNIFLFFFSVALFFNEMLFWYQLILENSRYSFMNLSLVLGLDGISLCFLLLSSFIIFISSLTFWNLKYQIGFYSLNLFFSLFILCNVFLSLDFFYFYIFFEAILIPMFLLISTWGSRSRKVYAAYQLFLYTLLGSILVLLVFISIYLNKGSSSFDFILDSQYFSKRYSIFWIFLFLGFSIKVPIVPFHIWLPEAHVEAPTTGSVILAAILLKLGIYAMLRFLFIFLPAAFLDFLFLVLLIGLMGFLYASFVALNQIDIKKIIAYSSIAHMNFTLLGLFSLNFLGLTGSFVMMFGHALTASSLFLGIGVLYDRYKTRLIFYYSSMALFMPLFSVFYFCFIISNFGFPGTVNFVGEFLISTGAFAFSNFLMCLSTIAFTLSLIYSLFLYNRIFFGPLQVMFLRYYSDYTRLDFFIHLVLVSLILFFGFYPFLLWAYPFAKLLQLHFFLI